MFLQCHCQAGDGKAVADGESEVEYRLDFDAWQARARKVMAAKTLLELTSGYAEAFMLLDTIVVGRSNTWRQSQRRLERVKNMSGAVYAKRVS